VTHRIVVITGGQDLPVEAFVSMLDSLAGVEYRLATQPDAQELLHPKYLREAEVVVFFDMPGVVLSEDSAPRFPMPSEKMVIGFRRLLTDGKPMLFVHRAIGGWPAWQEYAEIVGGKFLYTSDWVRGRRYPESGVRAAQTHTISPCDPAHPIAAGLEAGFTITDELLLCPAFDKSMTPLLVSDADFSGERFVPSRPLTAQGANNWRHPRGGNVVGWARSYERSPIVYLQPGGSASAFGHPAYRRLLSNAVGWLSSDDAAEWAAEVR
jgi:hypothetical protein